MSDLGEAVLSAATEALLKRDNIHMRSASSANVVRTPGLLLWPFLWH
jgi:hypothetical protein